MKGFFSRKIRGIIGKRHGQRKTRGIIATSTAGADRFMKARTKRVRVPTVVKPLRAASIRSLLKDVATRHSTEIARQLQRGLLHKKSSIAYKYLVMAAAYIDGKPVETHRMVDLQDGPGGEYNLDKLTPDDQKALLKLLKRSKDKTLTGKG